MIRIFCLLAVLGLGRCLDHLPSRQEIEASINRTIEEVERKVQADSSLPRLSRKDIVDILHNITSKDLISYHNKTLESTRNEYQRALMVVLPHNINGADESLEDLYTKAPMVQMVSDDIDSMENGFKIPLDEPHLFEKQTSDNLIATFPTSDSLSEESTTKEHYKNFENDQKFDKRPEKFSFDLEKLAKAPSTTQRPLRTWKPIPKRTTVSSDSVPTSSSDAFLYKTSLSTTEKPISKSTQHVLSSNQWNYHAPPTTPRARYRPSQKEVFLPTIQGSLEDDLKKQKEKQNDKKQELSMSLFKASDAMTFPIKETEHPSPIYVTPMVESRPKSTTPPPMRKEVEELLQSIGLRPMQNDDTQKDLALNTKLLESKFQIPGTNKVNHDYVSGLTAADIEAASIIDQNTFGNSNVNFKKGVNNLTPSIQLLFEKFGLQTSLNVVATTTTTTTTTTTVKPTLPSYNSYTNFKPLPNFSVRDKEMREFLAGFGLGVGEARNQKTLKAKKNTREEPPSLIEAVPGNMKRILENIGLITRNRERSEHSSEVDLQKEVTIQTTPAPKLHVFKPHETSLFNDQQRSKINELLETVKKVQRGKAKVEEVQRVADEVLETTKSLPEGPDPASLEEILKLYKEDLRNEVKRQQASEDYDKKMEEDKGENAKKEEEEEKKEDDEEKTETEEKGQEKAVTLTSVASGDSMIAAQELAPASVTITTAAPTSKGSFFDNFDIDAVLKNAQENSNETSSSSSSSASSPNLTALEESFGGTTKKPDPVIPTRRRTGLYFLVDWNTFLEVGEDGKDKVNLRFQPKVGDRTRFVKVTVP